MLSSSPLQSSDDEQLQYFLCTCGAEFELYHEYYNHLMQEMGMSQQNPTHLNSSNYSNFSIVSTVKFEQESRSQASQQLTILEENFKEQEEDLKQESSEGEQSIQTDLKSLASSTVVTPIKRNCRCWKRWNDFMLIKNKKCKEGPFYCGNCEIIYFQIEDFVSHCVQQCHAFENLASSHFITDQKEQKKRKNTSNKKQKIPQSQKRQSLRIQGPILNHSQCKPFNQIFIQQLDHRNLPFYCGLCQVNFFSFKNYNLHIIRFHQNQVDPSSSHIVLRFSILNNNVVLTTRWLYLSTRVDWINQDEKYYCFCQPQIKISMVSLLKHVQQSHNGVSPVYLGKFQTYYKRYKKAKKNEIDQDEEAKYHLFKEIFKNKSDHRNIEFFCGECSFKTHYPIKYLYHIERYSHNSNLNRNSHIILRLRFNYYTKNIYLSPAVQWETKEAKYFCACNVHKKIQMKDLIQHIYVEHDGISPYYPIDPTSRSLASYDNFFYKNVNDEAIRSIIAIHLIYNEGRFKCKLCFRYYFSTLTPSYYTRHIMGKHNKIVDPKYHTHILIQAKYNKWQLTHYFYLPILSQIEDDSLKYYCPCQNDHKMNINSLIDHILKQHNGVSPTYSLDQ